MKTEFLIIIVEMYFKGGKVENSHTHKTTHSHTRQHTLTYARINDTTI